MTDVIKKNGMKEPLKPEKIKKSLEEAVRDAVFSPEEKMKVINLVSDDSIKMAQKMDHLKTKQIRDVILNDLENNDIKIAKARPIYERHHDIEY